MPGRQRRPRPLAPSSKPNAPRPGLSTARPIGSRPTTSSLLKCQEPTNSAPETPSMNLKTGLATALVAAVVAALVTAATIALIWRLAPGVVNVSSFDEQRVVNIVRDYLTKNPEILVEMTTELDKRQAA